MPDHLGDPHQDSCHLGIVLSEEISTDSWENDKNVFSEDEDFEEGEYGVYDGSLLYKTLAADRRNTARTI